MADASAGFARRCERRSLNARDSREDGMAFALDRRTRTEGARQTISCDRFLSEELPRLIRAHGEMVAAGMRRLEAPPLALKVDEKVWTLRSAGDSMEVIGARADDALLLTLTADQFSDLAQNLLSLTGLLIGGNLPFSNGTLAEVSAWDALWLTLLEGWTVVEDGLTFTGLDGQPLDLHRRFLVDDDPGEIAHFLRETGYVRLRGWLAPSDLAEISADMDRALPGFSEGDGKSWWATVEDGSRRCVRLQKFFPHSPTLSRILEGEIGERLRRTLGGADTLLPIEKNVEALFKPVGVVAGLSNLSFHRDCQLGRHSYACCKITLGLPLTPTNDENGLLQVVAGSHRVAMPMIAAQAGPYLPVVGLATEVGDVTAHLSCTLHGSTPPLLAERRVVYAGTQLPPRDDRPASTDNAADHIRRDINTLLGTAQ